MKYETWQSYKDYPVCSKHGCGEVLLGPYEITTGVCNKCRSEEIEDAQEYHIKESREWN